MKYIDINLANIDFNLANITQSCNSLLFEVRCFQLQETKILSQTCLSHLKENLPYRKNRDSINFKASW